MSEAITVTVLDTITGECAISSDWSLFWWAEGNGSCDCNRESLFGRNSGDVGCLGCDRYVIIETSAGTLEEMNDGYDPALWREVTHGR